MKKISIKNIYLILVISIGLIVLGIGSTYAMFTSSSNIDNPISLSSNLTYSSDIFESFDITLSSKESKTIKLNINNNTNISSINYASWYIYEGSDTDLTFYTIIDNSTDIEPSGTLSTSGSINIKIVNNTTNKVSLTVGLSSNKDNIVLPDYMKLITVNKEKTFADYITNLYTSASKTTVTNNSITYNYASSENLMNDRLGGTTTSLDGGNIRYYGANPNNYIYFNCSDYSNQTSDTCELWRIIGVFNNQIKIIRNESVGSIEYDTYSESSYLQSLSSNKESSSANTLENKENNSKIMLLAPSADGINDYADSSLQKILNNYYYNRLKYVGNSTHDFTSNGIKNDETKKKIAKVTWNLGGASSGYNSNNIYSEQVYDNERGTSVYSGHSTTWPGNIALAYPSDYGYAADFNSCSGSLSAYNDNLCTSNNWMYPVITNVGSSQGWLLTPDSSGSYAWLVFPSGVASSFSNCVDVAKEIFPTLYLNSEETLYEDNSDGSSTSPYKLNP